MARMKKEFRELTVSEACNYGRKTAPMLRIQGLWLQDLGFQIGDPVLVKCEDGKLIITLDKANEEIWEAEEKATQELEQRFQREKEILHARFVAERRATYGNEEVTVVE